MNSQPTLDFPGFTRRATARQPAPVQYEMVVDNFAGAGGASMGMEVALGRCVDVSINHNPLAVQIHMANHPNTKHYTENIFKVDPLEVCAGRSVGLAWFSPDCTHFSRAKGGKPVSKKIRGLAWVVVKWAAKVKPRVIILENVCEFKTWGPVSKEGVPIKARAGETYKKWVRQLRALGYQVEDKELVAADFGVPTIRKRLFLIARRDGLPIVWPAATHARRQEAAAVNLQPWVGAHTCIDWSLPMASIFGRKKNLAKNTQRRIAAGLKKFLFEAAEPFFLTVFNHGGKSSRARSLDEPFCTVTGARDAHAVVMPWLEKVGENPRRESLAAAWLLKHNAGPGAVSLREPAPTQLRRPHESLVAAHLVKFYGTNTAQDIQEPAHTVTSQGRKAGLLTAFLVKYFGTGENVCDVRDPASTVTSKPRLGLVEVATDSGPQQYKILDIFFRMVHELELLRFQFGKWARDYVLLGTQEQKIAGIGNSVCPELAAALVKANVEIRLVTNL